MGCIYKIVKDIICFMCYEVILIRLRLIGDCDDIWYYVLSNYFLLIYDLFFFG